jgi:exosortase/archaeosortase family protein
MNITFDDPRLTAYALDELDEAGRSVIESEMQNFSECRHEVDELTSAFTLVRAGLTSEPMPELLPAQQQAIESKLRRTGSKAKLSWIPSTRKTGFNWALKTAFAVVIVLLFSVERIPVPAMRPALSILQNVSVNTAYAMMQVAGIPAIKNGSSLVVTDAQNQAVSFGIAPECYPIFWSFLVASLLAGNLYLKSPWKRLFLTMFVIPLVVARDSLRIFTIAELCIHTSVKTAIDSPIFQYCGSIFFALLLVPFILFLVWLRKLEAKS